MKTFNGKTSDASSTILGAKFWKKGIKIEGTVQRKFKTTNGDCYNLNLLKPVKVKNETTGKVTEETQVAVGALKGFDMALQAAGVPNNELLAGDKIILECTGTQDSGKGNDLILFTISVGRE